MMPRTDEAEEAVRRYVTKVLRRYLPVALFFGLWTFIASAHRTGATSRYQLERFRQ